MKIKFLTPLFVCLALLVACQQKDAQEKTDNVKADASKVDKADAVAIVNGKVISKQALEKLKTEISQRMRGQQFPEKQLVDELIKREILVAEALKQNLDQSPEFLENIEAYKTSLLSQIVIQDHFKKNEISDAELKAEYDKQNQAGSIEYKARHILVKSEQEAKDVIAKLDTGSDFSALAKEHSTGPSGSNGGDLGWFNAGQMVPSFSAAVTALENGKYTSEPVQTSFGWHVILREDSREKAPPPFEEVKAQLMPKLQRQKVLDYLNQLREQATIEIIEPEVEPAPAPENAAAETATDAKDAVTEAKPETDLAVPVEDAGKGHEHGSDTTASTSDVEATEKTQDPAVTQ